MPTKYSHIKAAPSKPKKGLFSGGNKQKRRSKQVILTIIGVYVVAGGLLGGFLFSQDRGNEAEAEEPAQISSSIRFTEDPQDLQLGDKVSVSLTLQNTSIKESLNEISLDLLSTGQSIRWQTVKNLNKPQLKPLKPQADQNFELPVLSAGERVKYQATGQLVKEDISNLTVLGRLDYQNQMGAQETETNRIYTKMSGGSQVSTQLYRLTLDKPKYKLGEVPKVKVTHPSQIENKSNSNKDSQKSNSDPNTQVKGKLVVTNRNTLEPIKNVDCQGEKQCTQELSDLPTGKYSLLFQTKDEVKKFSNIQWFEIVGEQQETDTDFTPTSQATLEAPFGSKSIRGQAPVLAKQVISRNFSGELPTCQFEVVKNGKKFLTKEAQVTSDRHCKTTIRTQELPKDGVYVVKLKGTNKAKQISFLPKEKGLVELQNRTLNLKKGNSVKIEANDLVNDEGDPIKSSLATVYIYHQNSGTLEELKTIKGLPIKIEEGELQVDLPSQYFARSGNYKLWFSSEAGRSSHFLEITLADEELGLSNTGVMVNNYENLRVDKEVSFKLQGVRDQDGKTVQKSSCQAEVYGPKSGTNPITLNGQIQEGECLVKMSKGSVTEAGPILVSFAGDNASSSIPQSRIFTLRPGTPKDYGQLNLEFNPPRRGYANKLFIGPVVDKYGNLTDVFDQKVIVKNGQDKVIKTFEGVDITQGYAHIGLPSSLFQGEKLIFQLQNQKGKELLKREVVVLDAPDKLRLPSIPDTLPADEKLEIGISDIPVDKKDTCLVKFIPNLNDYGEKEFPYDPKKQTCQQKIEFNEYRDKSQALVKFYLKDWEFSQIVDIEAGEPANLFTVRPQLRVNNQEDLEVNLLTSPLVDRYGQPVDDGQLKWEVNGEITQNNLNSSTGKLELVASQLSSQDITTDLDQRFLNLDVDVEAGLTSISQTKNLEIFLAEHDLANSRQEFQLVQGSNYLATDRQRVFAFQSSTCQASKWDHQNQYNSLKTHYQAGKCYVQVQGSTGRSQIMFTEKGFPIGNFRYRSDKNTQAVNWCANDDQGCYTHRLLNPTQSKIEATIYDGEKEYKFTSDAVDNTVTTKQNGLNPLKEYLVEISYTDTDGREVSHYRQITGEKLLKEQEG